MSLRLNFSDVQKNVAALAEASSSLRAAPTNLNYDDFKCTELYGTAPFRARGIQKSDIDVESSLLHNTNYHGGEHYKDYYNMREHVIHPVNHVYNAFPRSTRADVRNKK